MRLELRAPEADATVQIEIADHALDEPGAVAAVLTNALKALLYFIEHEMEKA